MTNEQVKCLQTLLLITSDGIFGPKTKAAVILFQKAHLLTPDGIVGTLTKAKLMME
jgi:peptidoglycan hydrolase-like protein with peptidoglycan-binding domain